MMKKLWVALGIGLAMSGAAFAQNQGKVAKTTGAKELKTTTFAVSGNCGMCKAAIEKALKTKGVKKAEWNASQKTVAVRYYPAQINEDALHQRVAAAGYDTEKAKAPAAAYDKLPGCCKYRK